MKLIICIVTLLFASCSYTSNRINNTKPPNFLIIMADDCTYNDLPVYGGQNAKTPQIDKLASEGLVFDQAYVATAMCQPCRAELYTGLYPFSNGCSWNHSSCLPNISSMPQDLTRQGYRVGIAGKVHVAPKKVFPFKPVKGFDGNCVSSPTQKHSCDGILKFMKDKKQPFCLVVGLVEPHVPWLMGDASQYPVKGIKLPSNLADTPITRREYASYLAEITYMDSQVGDILKALDESGQSDNTLVLFTTEQGSQFPGCKWTNYNTGVHSGVIVKWPHVVAAGKRTNALVQYADILPTFMDLAGSKDLSAYDGKSFSSVLKGYQQKHRSYVYGAHNNVPEGPPYPIRSISNGTFHYIRNLSPDDIYIEKHLMGRAERSPYWPTWLYSAATSNKAYELIKRFMHRPAEELYHMGEDPYELNNLAEDNAYQKIKKELSEALDKWMQEQGDPGKPQDKLEALKNAKAGKHIYKPKPKKK